MMPPLRIVFFGTAHLACPSLDALAAEPEFQVTAVVTQPDRPKGRDLTNRGATNQGGSRGEDPPDSSAGTCAPPGVCRGNFPALRPDLIVVAAYGQILPAAILDLPRYGCINVHASLLPKYRGAAPIQWSILSDDSETGVTIMKMDAGLDTGDILTQRTVPIETADNGQSLHDKLAGSGSGTAHRNDPALRGRQDSTPQTTG